MSCWVNSETKAEARTSSASTTPAPGLSPSVAYAHSVFAMCCELLSPATARSP